MGRLIHDADLDTSRRIEDVSTGQRHVVQPERQTSRADQRDAQDAGGGDGAGLDPDGKGG